MSKNVNQKWPVSSGAILNPQALENGIYTENLSKKRKISHKTYPTEFEI